MAQTENGYVALPAAIWRALTELTPTEQLVYWRVACNEQVGVLGVYRVEVKAMAAGLELDAEAFRAALAALDGEGLVAWDDGTRMICIRGLLAHSRIDNAKHALGIAPWVEPVERVRVWSQPVWDALCGEFAAMDRAGGRPTHRDVRALLGRMMAEVYQRHGAEITDPDFIERFLHVPTDADDDDAGTQGGGSAGQGIQTPTDPSVSGPGRPEKGTDRVPIGSGKGIGKGIDTQTEKILNGGDGYRNPVPGPGPGPGPGPEPGPEPEPGPNPASAEATPSPEISSAEAPRGGAGGKPPDRKPDPGPTAAPGPHAATDANAPPARGTGPPGGNGQRDTARTPPAGGADSGKTPESTLRACLLKLRIHGHNGDSAAVRRAVTAAVRYAGCNDDVEQASELHWLEHLAGDLGASDTVKKPIAVFSKRVAERYGPYWVQAKQKGTS